jgi:threonylcarbamoyladenosine tRNA methylthiotransferase MtaB
MPTYRIITLGCKVNQAESEQIRKRLKETDWQAAGPGDEPEVCIINTCAVTRKAAMQSRQAVRQAIHSHPGAAVVVTGCYAQTDPPALQQIGGLDYILDQAAKAQLAEWLGRAVPEKQTRALQLQGSAGPGFGAPTVSAGRTRPFFKIQDGCDAFCTYCIVPYARGRSRSMPAAEVLEGIAQVFASGFRELVLTGIHLGRYGLDLDPPQDLASLLRAIAAERPAGRIRLSSIEPLELTDEILDLAAGCGCFCPHFHIPLQSGDPEILRRMGRPYAPEAFRGRIAAIRSRMPEAAIGVDILAGFPGETEAAFENTFDLIRELPVTYLHVFPFSPRPGTAACDYTPRVDPLQVKQRCERLRRLGREKRRRFHDAFAGRRIEVLVESRRDPGSGLLKGISANYLPVIFAGDDALKNTLARIRITGTGPAHLTGEVVAAENIRTAGG